jgi:excisionase family DNA binding protein
MDCKLMTDDILTIKELSSYLKTSEKTIYRLLSKNEIPAFKVGTIWIKEKSEEAA